MFERLKEFLNTPYALPLTHPAKAVGRWAYRPIENFFDGVKYGLESKSDQPVYLRVFRALIDKDSFYAEDHTKTMTWAGVVLGAASAIAGAAIGAHALGLGWIGMTVAGIGATSFGMMAGPFIVAGVVASAAAVAGLAIAAVPSFVEGIYLARKQGKSFKAQAAATKAVPQLKAATPELRQEAAAMLKKIAAMPAEAQVPLLKELNEQYRGRANLSDTDGIVKAIDALPEVDRQKLVTSLQETLKKAFDAVAEQESSAAMALHVPLKPATPLKLKGTSASS